MNEVSKKKCFIKNTSYTHKFSLVHEESTSNRKNIELTSCVQPKTKIEKLPKSREGKRKRIKQKKSPKKT
jgi:hypothetical protein